MWDYGCCKQIITLIMPNGFREKFRNLYFSALINKNKLSNAIYLEPNYIIQKNNNKTISVIHDLSNLNCPEYHPLERVKSLSYNF